MIAGGPTEIIAHFAGHMRLLDTVVLHREVYDGEPGRLPAPAPETPHREAAPNFDLDEMPSRPYPATLPPPDMLRFGHDVLMPAGPVMPAKLAPGSVPVGVPRTAAPAGGGGGGSAGRAEADRDVTPDQELIQVLQVNELHDNDLLLMVEGTGVEHLHRLDPGFVDPIAALDRMLAEARGGVPADLVAHGTGTGDWIAFVQGRDAQLAAGGMPRDGVDDGSADLQGLTVDGVRQPAGTALPTVSSPAPTPEAAPRNGLLDPGLAATTGANQSFNVAGILDNHTQHHALFVGGDAFTTQAIVQVNVLASDVDITVGGRSGILDLVTGGDLTRNAARFTQADTDPGVVTHLSAGARTEVDVIAGDFYDVKSITQINRLFDNDVVVQGTFSTFYTAVAGANTQVNLFSLEELGSRYDLIVVRGDYHTVNMVHQTNVLLNDSIVKAYAGRADTIGQTIVTGDNVLENVASVDQYGSTAFKTLSADQHAALSGLEANHLDPALAALLPQAESSTLHVLYVAGDFFNINAITQTNIVANVDTVIQHLPDPGTATGPTGAATQSTQTVTTGANHLANVAAISTVGTTTAAQFVGGEHYDDAILVQANYVSHSARVTIGDTQSLASEVAAFTGLHDIALPETGTQDQLGPAFHGGGSSLTHDLLHGMMA
ncbi:hypothetical protein ASF27_09510 [Methylobacterium sp. Leaf102]|uniref:hypothetical protein n=1 Tax=Methylobacterium sp. Leaf102 TaxID=1736253 RepID=UPI0006FD5FB5|nr:hypothetical protein [Methylobacterium sp. Leaf102]KQP25171.1 hypothetical protein ASF27_09510 [Methylobacterium sp. Leaf102]